MSAVWSGHDNDDERVLWYVAGRDVTAAMAHANVALKSAIACAPELTMRQQATVGCRSHLYRLMTGTNQTGRGGGDSGRHALQSRSSASAFRLSTASVGVVATL